MSFVESYLLRIYRVIEGAGAPRYRFARHVDTGYEGKI